MGLYGRGSLFRETQETLDDIFAKVPPPVASRASRRRKDWGGGKGMGAAAPRPVQMAQVFNNRNAVCVHGDTEVTVKRRNVVSVINIANVQKGDLVLNSNKTFVEVECLVETVVDDDKSGRIPPE